MTGDPGGKVRAAFRHQAGACADLGSAFMARLMALAADRLAPGVPVADRILGWEGDVTPKGQSVPLRFAGALHALRLSGHPGLAAAYPPHDVSDDALWSAVEGAMEGDADFLMDRLASPPQTNEVRRSAVIAPALHLLAARFGLPVDLIEIGCSAGLNLRADRFRVTAGSTAYGPGDAEVRLVPDWRGGPPPAPADLRIGTRTGIDIRPLDPVADETRLLSYLWPDQPRRIALTRAAVAVAAEVPARIVAADAPLWLEAQLHPARGCLTLLFHTFAWQYLPDAARDAGDRAIALAGARASAEAPMARFAMEAGPGAAMLTLQLWPEGVTLDLGRADYHGRWVEWAQDRLAGGHAHAT